METYGVGVFPSFIPTAMSLQARELMVCHSCIALSACHSPHIDRPALNTTCRAIDYERDEDAIKTKALSFFANWSGGSYGSESNTDTFIVCPRATAMTPFMSEGVVYTPVIPGLAEVYGIPTTVLHIIPAPPPGRTSG